VFFGATGDPGDCTDCTTQAAAADCTTYSDTTDSGADVPNHGVDWRDQGYDPCW